MNLRCIEESLALKCVWNDSKAQKLHFDVLNVNPAMVSCQNTLTIVVELLTPEWASWL